MRKRYDCSDGIENPYAKRLKKQITILIEKDILDYFKKLSAETDLPYQKLINLFLRDCAEHHKRPSVKWTTKKAQVV